MLRELGYEVTCAKDAAQGINLYKQAKVLNQLFAAVLVDLTMPGEMGGKETIKHLLAIDPKVKAIVSSGYPIEVVMSDYKKYGFSGAISKPYRIEELDKMLNRIISEKEPNNTFCCSSRVLL
ncbi:MAG: response regulator [Candidatus Desulfofervidaceae bacterium]|nr:response regulator [Candidatus Desulfofervidaceae bacterium]